MTAEFIGSVNIFEAHIREDEADSVTLTSDLLDAPVFIDRGVTTPAESTATLVALRPEKIYLTPDKPDGEHNWSCGTVDNIAYLGDITSYYVKLA
ncbi:TOBE domain-containing protein, partial [Marinobacter sp. UBA2498]